MNRLSCKEIKVDYCFYQDDEIAVCLLCDHWKDWVDRVDVHVRCNVFLLIFGEEAEGFEVVGALNGKDGEGSRQIGEAAVFNLKRKRCFGVADDFE